MFGHVRCPQWCLEGFPPIRVPGDLFLFQGCQDGFPSNCAQVPTHVMGQLAGTSCVPFPCLFWCRCFNGSSNFFLSQPGGSCVSCHVGPSHRPPRARMSVPLVHARIGPHISPQLDECQGVFRWGADSLVGSLVDLLTSRSSSPSFVAFIDIHKAFDTSWVEGTLVRLYDAGVSGQMWKLMSQFLRGTQSQVRVGSSLSHPWFDSGIAQGRVLSPLLFNLLVNGLAAAVRRSAPGAQFFPTGVRFPCQVYADDVVIPADSESDLQIALDALQS